MKTRKERNSADSNQGIKLNEHLASVYNSRGEVKLEIGDYDGVIADFSEAIRLNPNYAEAYCNRGTARMEKVKQLT